MARIEGKIAKLIERSASSFEEEARTAAVQACRLIREHHLHVISSEEIETIKVDAFEEALASMPRELLKRTLQEILGEEKGEARKDSEDEDVATLVSRVAGSFVRKRVRRALRRV